MFRLSVVAPFDSVRLDVKHCDPDVNFEKVAGGIVDRAIVSGYGSHVVVNPTGVGAKVTGQLWMVKSAICSRVMGGHPKAHREAPGTATPFGITQESRIFTGNECENANFYYYKLSRYR